MSKLLEFALGRVAPPNESLQRRYNKFASSAVEILTTNLTPINDFFFLELAKSREKIPQQDSHKELAEKCHESSFNDADHHNTENHDANDRKTGSQKHDFFLRYGWLTRRELGFGQRRGVLKRPWLFRLELPLLGAFVRFHNRDKW